MAAERALPTPQAGVVSHGRRRGGGRPCIRGLRVRVKDVLDLLAAGATRDEVLEDLSYLESEDLDAVLQNDHPVLLRGA